VSTIQVTRRQAILSITERDCQTVVHASAVALATIVARGPQGPQGISFSGSQFLDFSAIETLDAGDTGAILQWDGSVFSPASGIINPDILQPAQQLTEDVTLESNRHGLSVGPVTIASGVTVTVPSNAVWAIV